MSTQAPSLRADCVRDAVVPAILESVRLWGGHSVSIPSDFECQPTSGSAGGLVLRSWAWSSLDFTWMRLTEITGDEKTLILNLGLFPSIKAPLPIVQAEILVFGNKLFLMIADVFSLSSECDKLLHPSPPTLLERIGRTHLLPPVDESEKPEWCGKVFSSSVVWSRPGSLGEMSLSVVESSIRLLLDGVSLYVHDRRGVLTDEAERDKRRTGIRDLCTTMIEKDPSRAFLNAKFGEEWTNRYISDFLFPPFTFKT